MPSGIYTRTYFHPKGVCQNTGRTHFQIGHIPANKGTKKPGIGGRPKGGIPWNKGLKNAQVAWNKGTAKPEIKVSREDWIKNLRLSHIGKMKGVNNPNWKGGVTPVHNRIRRSIESKLWIQAVFARDGYVCQKTGLKGGRLTAHHILNFSQYPELRFAIDNGITLSVEAHEKFHKIYGKKNNTRLQLEEFLNKKI